MSVEIFLPLKMTTSTESTFCVFLIMMIPYAVLWLMICADSLPRCCRQSHNCCHTEWLQASRHLLTLLFMKGFWLGTTQTHFTTKVDLDRTASVWTFRSSIRDYKDLLQITRCHIPQYTISDLMLSISTGDSCFEGKRGTSTILGRCS